jgi:hypothetical protein
MENYDPRTLIGGFDPNTERFGLALSASAVRYLVMMLERERNRMVSIVARDGGYGIKHEAAYGSIHELEQAIPAKFWDKEERKRS